MSKAPIRRRSRTYRKPNKHDRRYGVTTLYSGVLTRPEKRVSMITGGRFELGWGEGEEGKEGSDMMCLDFEETELIDGLDSV